MTSRRDITLRSAVKPSHMTFFMDDPQTHSQSFTILNPQDCSVGYKVLGTSPERYSVKEPSGSVSPRHCVDIKLRLREKPGEECRDRFEVRIYRSRRYIESCEVTADVRKTRGPDVTSGPEVRDTHVQPAKVADEYRRKEVSVVQVIALAVALSVGLCSDPVPLLPSYLSPSHNVRYFAFFIAGMLVHKLLQR